MRMDDQGKEKAPHKAGLVAFEAASLSAPHADLCVSVRDCCCSSPDCLASGCVLQRGRVEGDRHRDDLVSFLGFNLNNFGNDAKLFGPHWVGPEIGGAEPGFYLLVGPVKAISEGL